MMGSMETRLTISRYAKQEDTSKEELEQELIEALEKKDERFRKMGLYFKEERDEALRHEINNVIR